MSTLIPLIFVAVLLVIVFFSLGERFRNKFFPFFKGSSNFEDKKSVSKIPEILRYKIVDGSLEYYTGTSWEKTSRTIHLNDKMLKPEEVIKEVEDYYYGRGEYAEIYGEKGIRKIESIKANEKYFRVKPENIISVDDSSIKDARVYSIVKELLRVDKNRFGDSQLSEEFGWLKGTFEKLIDSSEGSSFQIHYFLLSNENKLYVHKGTGKYELIQSSNALKLIELLVSWRDEILKVPINLPIDDSDSVSVCPEINSGYLILRIDKGEGQSGIC